MPMPFDMLVKRHEQYKNLPPREMFAHKKVHPTLFKDLDSSSNIARWLVLVTPWGGDVAKTINGYTWEKDLGGDYFYPAYTDFADSDVYRLKSFYEHSVNALVNPYMPEDMQYLGGAVKTLVDDWGRWFTFEVDRTLPYYQYLESLKSMNLLGASTQAYFGGVTREADGRLKRWWENEVSLTPTPMHPGTISQVYELAKTFQVPFNEEWYDQIMKMFDSQRNVIMLTEKTKEAERKAAELDGTEEEEAVSEETPAPVPDESEAATEEEPVASEEEEEFDEEGFAKNIRKQFEEDVDESADDGTEDEDAAEELTLPDFADLTEDFDLAEELDGKSIADLLIYSIQQTHKSRLEMKELASFVSGYVDVWGNLDDLPDLVAVMQSIQSVVQKNLKVSNATQKGIQVFAESVADRLKADISVQITEEHQKSKMEQEADEDEDDGVNRKRFEMNNGPKFPANAPGGRA